MNAAKAKKNPAKFKGAVLIMILAVMTVLIILLAGSIAVVYSAHNRAYVKYTESQGYYTARSILDNFFAELNNNTSTSDSAGNDIGTYYKLTGDDYDTLEADTELGIGRSIDLDTFKAKVQVKDGAAYKQWFKDYCDENKTSLSKTINNIEGSSTDYTTAADGHNSALYTKVEQYLVNLDRNALSDYSTYSQYYDQYLPVTSVAAGMQPDTIVYELSSLAGFGNGTIDTDGDGTADTTIQLGSLADNGVEKAWVTVQVQERVYSMGDGSSYAECFRKGGSHKEDHFVAKVTSHVIFNGEEVTTSLIWKNVARNSEDGGVGAIATLGPLNTTTSFTAIGNATSLSDNFLELSNNSTYAGNVFVQGSFYTGTATPSVTMNKDDVFFVRDTLKVYTNPPQGSDLCNGALFYAGRTQLWSSGASFGSSTNQINLVTQHFESHSDTKEFYGRIFAEHFDVTTNAGELTKTWNATAIPTNSATFDKVASQKIHGDVYCNYLGIPADRVWVELLPASGVAKFHLNYDPVTRAPLPVTSEKRIERMVDAAYNLNVFQGISVIVGVEEVPMGTDMSTGSIKKGLANIYQEYDYPDNTGVTRHLNYFKNSASDTTALGAKFDIMPENTSNRVLQINETGQSTPANLALGTSWQVEFDTEELDGTNIHFYTDQNIKLNVDYDAEPGSGVWTLNDDYQKEFNLPSLSGTQLKLIGTNETSFKLPTHRSLYGDYFYEEITNGSPIPTKDTSTTYPKTFNEDTGAFTMKPNDTSHTFTFDDFIEQHALTGEAAYAGTEKTGITDVSTIPSFPLLTTPVTVAPGGGDTVNDVAMPSWQRVISSSGYIPANGGDGNVYLIDARTNSLDIQLGDGTSNQTFTGTFVVYGDNDVRVTVPGSTTGGSGQTIQLGTTGHAFAFMTEEILTGIFKDTIVLEEPITGMPDSAHSGEITSPPNICWYFSKNISKAQIATGGSGETAFCGYITAPSVFFDVVSGLNGLQRDTYYKGKLLSGGNDKYTFFGSLFCKKYTGGQHSGVCYISQKKRGEDKANKRLFEANTEYSWAC